MTGAAALHGVQACPCCGQALPADGDLAIDEAGIVVYRGRFCTLTQQQAALLSLLVAARGRVVARDALIAGLYLHESDEADVKIIDIFVHQIRKKLRPLGLDVQTAWGRGYRFIRPMGDATS